MAKLANLLVAWAEIRSMLLDQMTFIDEYQVESITKLWTCKQWVEPITCQHLRRDDHQPKLPIQRFVDQVAVIVQSGVAGGIFIDGNGGDSLQPCGAFLGSSQQGNKGGG